MGCTQTISVLHNPDLKPKTPNEVPINKISPEFAIKSDRPRTPNQESNYGQSNFNKLNLSVAQPTATKNIPISLPINKERLPIFKMNKANSVQRGSSLSNSQMRIMPIKAGTNQTGTSTTVSPQTAKLVQKTAEIEPKDQAFPSVKINTLRSKSELLIFPKEKCEGNFFKIECEPIATKKPAKNSFFDFDNNFEFTNKKLPDNTNSHFLERSESLKIETHNKLNPKTLPKPRLQSINDRNESSDNQPQQITPVKLFTITNNTPSKATDLRADSLIYTNSSLSNQNQSNKMLFNRPIKKYNTIGGYNKNRHSELESDNAEFNQSNKQ